MEGPCGGGPTSLILRRATPRLSFDDESEWRFEKDVAEWLKPCIAKGCEAGFAKLAYHMGDDLGYDKTHLRCRVEMGKARQVQQTCETPAHSDPGPPRGTGKPRPSREPRPET